MLDEGWLRILEIEEKPREETLKELDEIITCLKIMLDDFKQFIDNAPK